MAGAAIFAGGILLFLMVGRLILICGKPGMLHMLLRS